MISAEGPECLSAAKFGLLILENSCCSFIGINKINQTVAAAAAHPQQIVC